ncbi:uncharacterized protein SPPG_00125 [Spizellomyces punctatus DAOM BR117]|uniref:Cell cycle checkpoint protein RAD1 n=1 Tax=Spizellomyces punctatus (strain DAOM BR117) TaxID=645134 RepID=A0A0L0HU40_SPIPD|nr:uncharacterized protein SPPG_00125 [Spizellomyces punctatus DAOM BR117]KND04394.1 hypothetical protein SPPG_00125 [Spizellomyces punctatus DAOM BR117]|eukprot:XP_016612433.1 hypothetical protein SPPG_00125 [Spizellomyces punctatus DAOM BR117]
MAQDAFLSGRSTANASSHFKGKLDNVRSLVTILKAISFKEKANCVINRQGIQFIVEESKASQARTQIRESHFREFLFPRSRLGSPNGDDSGDIDSEICFCIELPTLLDCLTIFGGTSAIPYSLSTGGNDGGQRGHGGFFGASQIQDTQTGGLGKDRDRVAVRVICPLDGDHLSLMLEERGVVTECRLTTYNPEALTDLFSTFAEQRMVSKLIMKSDWLRDAFSELDGTSDTITLHISPDAPYFRLSASSLAGDAQMDYPKDTDVIESFHCLHPIENHYQHTLLQSCLKALSLSSKTSIRVNEAGFLSMQFMINVNEKDIEFVEYLISPIADWENE